MATDATRNRDRNGKGREEDVRGPLVLACDLGGTSFRAALAAERVVGDGSEGDGEKDVVLLERIEVPTEGLGDSEGLARTVRERFGAALQGASSTCAAGCLAVAGPVSRGQAEITNADLVLEEKRLSGLLGFPVTLVNDFAAVGASLDTRAGRDAGLCHGGKPDFTRTRAVVGAGTGFGCGLVLPDSTFVPSEGGHMSMAFREGEEEDFAREYAATLPWNFLTTDDVVSGRGLEALAAHVFPEEPRLCAAEAGERFLGGSAAAKDFPESNPVGRLFVRFFARACRDWALATLCSGGLWVAGGIAARNPAVIRSDLFADEFVSGRHAEWLSRVPVLLVRDGDCGLLGAAKLALGAAGIREGSWQRQG